MRQTAPCAPSFFAGAASMSAPASPPASATLAASAGGAGARAGVAVVTVSAECAGDEQAATRAASARKRVIRRSARRVREVIAGERVGGLAHHDLAVVRHRRDRD